MTPIFDFNIDKRETELEYFVDLYGKNNFKTQLLRIYNKVNNKEEITGITNFREEALVEKERIRILDKINNYLKTNKDRISPWELYEPNNYSEIDYIEILSREIKMQIYYVDKE